MLWKALYLMRLACYFHEKPKIIRTVTVHSVTLYAHTVIVKRYGHFQGYLQ